MSARNYKLYGYAINHEWLLWYGKKNGCVPGPEDYERFGLEPPPDGSAQILHIMHNAIRLLLATTGLLGFAKMRQINNEKGDPNLFVALATNDLSDGMLIPPPPDKWAKLKEVLKAKWDPAWYPDYQDPDEYIEGCVQLLIEYSLY